MPVHNGLHLMPLNFWTLDWISFLLLFLNACVTLMHCFNDGHWHSSTQIQYTEQLLGTHMAQSLWWSSHQAALDEARWDKQNREAEGRKVSLHVFSLNIYQHRSFFFLFFFLSKWSAVLFSGSSRHIVAMKLSGIGWAPGTELSPNLPLIFSQHIESRCQLLWFHLHTSSPSALKNNTFPSLFLCPPLSQCTVMNSNICMA